MKKYLGIILIALGALVLLTSYLLTAYAGQSLVDYNSVQFCGLGLCIAGLIAHIVITKRTK